MGGGCRVALARQVAKNFSMRRFSASVDLERLGVPAWRQSTRSKA
jgi:hypothetical protein